MGKATAVLPFEEQIPGEKYNPGERIRGYLYKVEETPKGIGRHQQGNSEGEGSSGRP